MTCALVAVYIAAKLVTYVNLCEITYIQETPSTCRIWTANGKFEADPGICPALIQQFDVLQLNRILDMGGPTCSAGEKQDNGKCHK